MKLLHVLANLDQKSGGPLRAVLDLSANALSHGLESELLGFGPVRIEDNPLPMERIHALPTRLNRKFAYCPVLGSWCDANLSRYDGVVLHGMWSYPLWAISKACSRLGIRYASFPHGMLDLWSVRGQGLLKRVKKTVYWHLFERHVLSGARQVFFTTDREMKNARRTFRFPHDGRILAPYGMNISTATSENAVSANLVQPSDARVALFLGRLHPVKNVELLIRGWAAARPPAEWRLVIAGPGHPVYLRRLEELVERHQLGNAIQFTGHVGGANKQYLLRRADWFLLPSQHENFGISVLEAASAGCAIAISREVYLADYFPSDSAEILSTDISAWVEFLKSRMPDRRWQSTVAEAARNKLGAQFDFESVTRAWVDTLQRTFSPDVETSLA